METQEQQNRHITDKVGRVNDRLTQTMEKQQATNDELGKRVTQLETTLLMMKNDKNLLDLLTGGRSMPAEL